MAIKIVAWETGTGNITATYDGSGNGSIAVSSDANNLYSQRSQQITVKTTDGSKQVTLDIVQAARQRIDLTNAVVTASNQTYNGSAKTPTPTVTLNGSTVPSSGYDVSYSNNTNAGTATIIITGKGDYTGTASGTFNIAKANPTYTAPTAKSLTYSRSAQSLVNAGSASGGTLYYKYTTTNSKPTSTSGFSSSIPTRTNASTYYVWYYVKADSNHNDTAISSAAVTVTIAKATPVVATAPSKRTGLSYTGSAQNLLSGGSMKHSSSDSTSVAGTFTYKQGTNAGTYSSLTWSFTPTDSTNYNSTSGSVSGSVTIAKASRTISFTSYPSSLEIGSSSNLAASVSAGSNEGTISFSSSNSNVASVSGSTVTGVSKGICTIYASISEGTNYLSASTSYTLSVTRVVPSGCVDLDLPSGLFWATMNIGANSVDEVGMYFSWGDISGHYAGDGYDFSTANYRHFNIKDDLTSQDDAAYNILGSNWRMPTKEDFQELYNNCTSSWTSYNGISGRLFTSKINGNTLFIPVSGSWEGTSIIDGTSVVYLWSSSYYSSGQAYCLISRSGGVYPQTTYGRRAGLPIRAVQE